RERLLIVPPEDLHTDSLLPYDEMVSRLYPGPAAMLPMAPGEAGGGPRSIAPGAAAWMSGRQPPEPPEEGPAARFAHLIMGAVFSSGTAAIRGGCPGRREGRGPRTSIPCPRRRPERAGTQQRRAPRFCA